MTTPPLPPRDVKKVPYVELFDGRLQGVVSSGSDIQRVYVAFFEAGSLNFACSTNNNRPCGGLRGAPCAHLTALLQAAIHQEGIERVVRYLRLPADSATYTTPQDILRHAHQLSQATPGSIFSRFLQHLALLELPATHDALPGSAWFRGVL